MQKKIALCLYGNFNSRLSQNSGKDGYEYIKEKILNNRNVDVFIHSWDLSNQSTIENCYGPLIKKAIFEKQLNFAPVVDAAGIVRNDFAPPGGQNFRTIENSLSFYYSRGKSIELKKQFEHQNNFKYDIVICSRFDLAQMDKYNGYQDFKVSEIVFDENLDMNFFYSAMWDQLNSGYTDMWYYSSSENMDKLMLFFEKAQVYYQRNSEYLNVLSKGWPDSNANDEFSNEFFRKEKSKNLLKYPPSLGHNNHIMHKWFFMDVGLYQKSRFLAVYPNKLCSLVVTDDNSLKLSKYLDHNEKYSRIVGPKFLLTTKELKNIPSSYQQFIAEDSQSSQQQLENSLLKLKKQGFEACLIESTSTILEDIIDYKQIKSAIKFVIRAPKGMPLRNGFDCIQLNKPSLSLGIRTISDKNIFWCPPFLGHLDFKIPTIWKIDSLLLMLQNNRKSRPFSFKCGFIFEKGDNGLNKIYPYKSL